MLTIHTPLNKVSRVSRSILPDGGPVMTGRWAALTDDGQVKKPVGGEKVHKLVIGNYSASQYEAQDVKSGRVTTVESVGDRFSTVLGDGITGPWNIGDRFYVRFQSDMPAYIGQLYRYRSQDRVPGVLEIVAMALNDNIPGPGAILEFQTISPYVLIQAYVTYYGNGNDGGDTPTDSNKYTEGDTVTVLGNTGVLVKAGHTFGGWNTKADGTGTTYAGGNTFVVGALNDIRLYALWVPIP